MGNSPNMILRKHQSFCEKSLSKETGVPGRNKGDGKRLRKSWRPIPHTVFAANIHTFLPK